MIKRPGIVTLTEACAVLQIHRNTAYRLIKDGELVPLPAMKLRAKRYRFNETYIKSLALPVVDTPAQEGV